MDKDQLSRKREDNRLTASNESVQPFALYLKRVFGLKENDITPIYPYCRIQKMKKNEWYSQKELNMKDCVFVLQGSLKVIHRKDKQEYVAALVTEGELCTVMNALYESEPQSYIAVCSEDSTLLFINHMNRLQIMEENPVFIKLSKELSERAIRFLQKRIISMQGMSAKERYEDLYKNYPEFIHRFSLQDIASYLGMSSETISRVRKPV